MYVFMKLVELGGEYAVVAGSDEASEGNFVLPNGEDLPYQLFHPGEPNDGTNENCLAISRSHGGGLHDFGCSTYSHVYAFCEAECKYIVQISFFASHKSVHDLSIFIPFINVCSCTYTCTYDIIVLTNDSNLYFYSQHLADLHNDVVQMVRFFNN